MYKVIKSNPILIFLLFLIVISYFLGFYLYEDSAGGGKIDYVEHEWGTIQLFKKNDLTIALSSIFYESSRTPLFYIINKFIPFSNNIENLRLFWFIFSITIPFLFYYTLKLLAADKIKKIYILLFSFVILLSPYFRTNAYWPSSENLQIFFVILAIFFYVVLIIKKSSSKFELYLLSSLSILSAYCAFYTDQKAFFLVALIYFDLIRRNNLAFFLIFSLFNFLLFLPAIYLFVSWEGLVPMESHRRVTKYKFGTNTFISSVGIYFMVIFISNFKNLNFWKKIRLDKLEIVSIFILTAFLFFTIPESPITFGSGIISKLFGLISVKFNLNWSILKYVYFLINLLFVGIIFLLVKKNLNNLIIFLSFILVYNLTNVTYQSYVDPILYIIILSVLDFKKNIVVLSSKLSFLFLIFYTLMLSSAILFRVYLT